VTQIDTVTQSNAAAAEEAAAASEELSAQAEMMRGTVNNLLHLVGGTDVTMTSAPSTKNAKTKQHRAGGKKGKPQTHAVHTPKSLPPQTGQRQLPPVDAKKTTAEDIIPFDDEEFENF
jgi:methyl-accepting chemotaxis protein